jgi:hypothetical protein
MAPGARMPLAQTIADATLASWNLNHGIRQIPAATGTAARRGRRTGPRIPPALPIARKTRRLAPTVWDRARVAISARSCPRTATRDRMRASHQRPRREQRRARLTRNRFRSLRLSRRYRTRSPSPAQSKRRTRRIRRRRALERWGPPSRCGFVRMRWSTE